MFEAPAEFFDFKLLTLAKLSEEQLIGANAKLACFRQPHPLLIALTKGVSEQKELAELIKSDPEIAAKVLTVVNSAQYSLQKTIKDINHAIIFLGVGQVKNIALQFAMRESSPLVSDEQSRAYQHIWATSNLASQLCLLLAKSIGKDNAAELSTLCLIMYLGDIVLLSAEPDVANIYLANKSFYQRISQTQQQFGVNSAILGQLLAKEWALPEVIEQDIGNSLQLFVNGLAKTELSDEQQNDVILCYIACRISEMAILQGKTQVTYTDVLEFANTGNLEFYYIRDAIGVEQFKRINNQLHANNFTTKAADLINRMSVLS